MLPLAAIVIVLISNSDGIIRLKENNPEFCRCGEARMGKKVIPKDIQEWEQDLTTTEPVTMAGDQNRGAHRVMALKALDNNKVMMSSGPVISLGKYFKCLF